MQPFIFWPGQLPAFKLSFGALHVCVPGVSLGSGLQRPALRGGFSYQRFVKTVLAGDTGREGGVGQGRGEVKQGCNFRPSPAACFPQGTLEDKFALTLTSGKGAFMALPPLVIG